MISQHISNVKLTNFRCFDFEQFTFGNEVNIISGLNGTGKTSVIDAIYCLAFGKSYFVSKDNYLIKEGTDFLRLEGRFSLDNADNKIVLKLQQGKSKTIEVDDVKRKRLLDHVGQIPVVCMAPSDINLVSDSSIVRRSLIDKLVSQVDIRYLECLVEYNRLLSQRNAYLKGKADINGRLLDVLDEQMAGPATYISKRRAEVVVQWLEYFNPIHKAVTGTAEDCSFVYESQLNAGSSYVESCKVMRRKDEILQRSNFGIHKDDIVFRIGSMELKNIGSQGQIKSFLFALKMAKFQILRAQNGKEPIVLLDDIFDKLDASRVENILNYLVTEMTSQIFITDTSADRLTIMFDKRNYPYTCLHL